MKLNQFFWRIAPIIFLIPIILMGIFNINDGAAKRTPDDSTRANQLFGNELERISEGTSVSLSTLSTPTLSAEVRNIPIVSLDLDPELDREINPRISHNVSSETDSLTSSSFLQLENENTSTDNNAEISLSSQISITSDFFTPIINIEGMGDTGVNPPDTTGAIGKNHYIQMVNGGSGALFSIYDREGNILNGATALDSLGSGNCSSGGGDPIVIYDQLADRWFMSEFNSTSSQFPLCHYVSQTADPLGAWHAYEFNMPRFPDYPKYGLWPTAYLGTANETGGGALPAIYAFDREAMLEGQPAGFIRLEATSLSGFGFQALTPVDLDGSTLPNSPSSALYLRHRDDESHDQSSNDTVDFIEIWSLNIDFDVPSNTSLQKIQDIPVSEFDSAMCGLNNFSCVPQPGSAVRLDPIREVVMQRAQYINHGTHESIVGNLVTDLTGSNQHAIFWFELRRSGADWELFQSGVFGDSADHRWMGSISMDMKQNLAMVYNVSSQNTFPSLRYSGRESTDPLGMFKSEEGSIGTGGAANPSTRYGDYVSLTLDPVDGCTFWATGQFNPSGDWGTQIATFRFPSCLSTSEFTLTNSNDNLEFLVGSTIEVPFRIAADENFTDAVQFTAMLLGESQILATTPAEIIPTAEVSTITIPIEELDIGPHQLLVTATTAIQTATLTIDFQVVSPLEDPAVIVYPPNEETYVSLPPTFSWQEILGASSYRLQFSSDPNFDSLIAEYDGLTSTQFLLPLLLGNDQTYYWRVRGENTFGSSEWSTSQFQTEPVAGQCSAGSSPVNRVKTSFESGLGDWSTEGSGPLWSISSTQVYTGSFSVMAGAPSMTSTQRLISPRFELAPSAGARWLSFDLWRDLESNNLVCNDGLILEVYENGSWHPIDPQLLISNPYDAQIATENDNLLEGEAAWCGTQDWTNTLIDLSEYSGRMQLRWHLATDRTVDRAGAYIDSVEVYECDPQDFVYYFPLSGSE
ncbi:MAG: hypothetical protein AAGD96_22135 [Chloroflexota bacterium]